MSVQKKVQVRSDQARPLVVNEELETSMLQATMILRQFFWQRNYSGLYGDICQQSVVRLGASHLVCSTHVGWAASGKQLLDYVSSPGLGGSAGARDPVAKCRLKAGALQIFPDWLACLSSGVARKHARDAAVLQYHGHVQV